MNFGIVNRWVLGLLPSFLEVTKKKSGNRQLVEAAKCGGICRPRACGARPRAHTQHSTYTYTRAWVACLGKTVRKRMEPCRYLVRCKISPLDTYTGNA